MMATDLRKIEPDDPRVRALVILVAAWRPAWDHPGIRAALHAAYKPGRTLEQLTLVALAAAQDVEARTPAAIGHAARWESANLPTTAPRPKAQTCARCGRLVTGEEHACYKPTLLEPELREQMTSAVLDGKAVLAERLSKIEATP